MFKSLFLVLALVMCAGAQSIDSNADGVLPRKHTMEFTNVAGLNVQHATWKAGMVTLDVWLLADDSVIVSLGGQELLAGSVAVLNNLPGGKQNTTVGTSGCWSAPITGSDGTVIDHVTISVHTTAEGDGAAAAVQNLKKELAEMQNLGYVPLPWGGC